MSNRLAHRTSRLDLPPLPPTRGGGGPQPPPWPVRGVLFWLSVLALVLSALLIFGMILWGLRLALIEHRLMARLGAALVVLWAALITALYLQPPGRG